MCLAIPGLVVERQQVDDPLVYALVDFNGLRRRVCISCVPEVQPGEYVIVHAGIALTRLDAVEAERLLAQLRDLGNLADEERGEP